MKKKTTYIKNICKYSVISLLAGLAFLSCGGNSGLGPEVDLSAPVVKITSHEDNTTVPAAFTLQGTAYDNEGVTSIKIDFDTANIHYKVVPGGKWYKKTGDSSEWIVVGDGKASCISSEKTWSWSVFVDTTEGNADSSTLTCSVVAEDAIGNTGKNSKVDCSLIVDGTNPDVTIYDPELFTGSHDAVLADTESYELKDGNVISKLLNKTLTLKGRQANSVSFKELRIEFDNGALSSGTMLTTEQGNGFAAVTTEDVVQNVSLGDEEAPKVYLTKIISGNLRNWELTVTPEEWMTDENAELKTGKHLIRIVTTSLSSSGAWQRKVIGYFIWWQEADSPWIKFYGDNEQTSSLGDLYPSSNISGTAQDDDGIALLSYSVQKNEGSSWTESIPATSINLSDKEAKYSPWTVKAPKVNGDYKITLEITDLYGAKESFERTFKVLDIQPPEITLSLPEETASVLEASGADKDGNITIRGVVSDDGEVAHLRLIYLCPNQNDNPENIIRYMTGSEKEWEKATASGYDDPYTDSNNESYSNKIFELSLGEPEFVDNRYEYKFEKTFNLFNDLNIGIESGKNCLSEQYFVFQAVDRSNANTVKQITVNGDSKKPVLSITKIQIFNSDDSPVTVERDIDSEDALPVMNESYYAILKGTCSDESTDYWNDASKIGNIEIKWDSAEVDKDAAETKQDLKNHTWSVKIKKGTVPKKSCALSVKLKDFGWNEAVVSKSITIETAEAQLERIGAEVDDGSYSNLSTQNTIDITLEFSKNAFLTTGSSAPTLNLNNGGTATYKSGSGTAKHIFTYEIKDTDKSTRADTTSDGLARLNVTSINANGGTWTDKSGQLFNMVAMEPLSKRNIVIDKDKPYVSSLKTLTSANSYKAGSQILFMLEFNENVVVTGKPTLNLGHTLAASNKIEGTSSGSKNILFVYNVKAGENSGDGTPQNETPISFSSISWEGVTVKDEAGNTLDTAHAYTPAFAAIIIDTKAPNAPEIGKGTNWTSNGEVITAEAGTSFTLTGDEAGAVVEYATDEDGTNWKKFTDAVALTANGTYYIRAKQTDKAGNESTVAAPVTVTLDRGPLLTRITADNVNGKYTTGQTITGRLVFRKEVLIGAGSKVTLNIKNGTTTSKDVAINGVGTAASEYTFSYPIDDGDSIDTTGVEENDPKYGLLDVKGWTLTSYKVGEVPVTAAADTVFATATSGKNLADNKQIGILTGTPKIQKVTLTGEGKNAVLKVTFDRNVTKVGGNITLEQDTTSGKYHVPTVLTAEEYNTLEQIPGMKTVLEANYKKGVNGATKNGTKLVNDTSTKYILNFDTDDTYGALVTAFTTTAQTHIVTIPIVADEVSITGSVMTVDLSGTYKLPVKGASYTILIPKDAVTDEVQNKNDQARAVKTAPGVEKPSIRIQTSSYTVTPGTPSAKGDYTENATVDMSSAQNAQIRIDCRTHGATLKYKINHQISDGDKVKTHSGTSKTETKTTDPDALDASDDYKEPTPPTNNDNWKKILLDKSPITGYDDACGVKYAITASAKANDKTEESWLFAARTVLKFNLNDYDGEISHGGFGSRGPTDSNNNFSATKAYEKYSLTFKDLKVWVTGGDSPYGGNTIDPFPLEWAKPAYFKLMSGNLSGNDKLSGKFYWVTWDITTATYHGFVIGTVPSTYDTEGPDIWYASECSWVTQKKNYVLYPGETLIMRTTGNDGTHFQFRDKNEASR